MSTTEPALTLGLEEEYLLVDIETLELANAPDALIEECAGAMEGQVSPEFLQCQIEVGTKVCPDIATARDDLKRLRSTVATHAARHGLAPIAASCHPLADWKRQSHTDKTRYNELEQALAGVARRLLICGMHVHVGVENPTQRIDLMNQLTYFLPHLLALSCSSPFWMGQDTGLASYRLTVFDNLPRTGLPPQLTSWAGFERMTGVLVDLGIIEDASKIWWDLRPSWRFPTLETRICDVPTLLEDTLTIAALTQCFTRMLWRLAARNQRWRLYDSVLVGENRWRAQRYGLAEGMIDFGRREILGFDILAKEMVELLEEDAEALGCREEMERVEQIVARGNSADRQRAVRQARLDAGDDEEEAMRAVVRHLIDAFNDGL
ncbi:carboxylate-amine ligase [Tropicimonas isoalkanivorans]|uniref:Putative glutamate--cysteine ligase 2 n=1 Tax=Tropicimonas isoalkanivorans TaxID=441112 RepID=A0A1I1E1L9_9RHOB|nr:carboxylate-amine ligase [Tropicimonas isoalkanivorans]SFB81159.1 carboxylate-amine ligase [Tropicimonas isoalkanivorans]